MPFGGADKDSFYPQDVSVDTRGDIYVTAVNDGVLKLAKGASEPTRIPFSGFDFALSAGADDAGNIYLADDGNGGKGRVQKLAPDGTLSELPFTDLGQDPHIAVAPDGTVYVADGGNNRVLKLSPNGTSPTALPFTGLKDPRRVAVSSDGNVYVAGPKAVTILVHDSQKTTELPVHDATKLFGIAVDASGNIYLTDEDAHQVIALKT